MSKKFNVTITKTATTVEDIIVDADNVVDAKIAAHNKAKTTLFNCGEPEIVVGSCVAEE